MSKLEQIHAVLHEFVGTKHRTDGGWCDAMDHAETICAITDYCVWNEKDDGPWETECGKSFEFTTDGLKENGFIYCYHCGRKIITSVTR